jgi:hypothetical protein
VGERGARWGGEAGVEKKGGGSGEGERGEGGGRVGEMRMEKGWGVRSMKGGTYTLHT